MHLLKISMTNQMMKMNSTFNQIKKQNIQPIYESQWPVERYLFYLIIINYYYYYSYSC